MIRRLLISTLLLFCACTIRVYVNEQPHATRCDTAKCAERMIPGNSTTEGHGDIERLYLPIDTCFPLNHHDPGLYPWPGIYDGIVDDSAWRPYAFPGRE